MAKMRIPHIRNRVETPRNDGKCTPAPNRQGNATAACGACCWDKRHAVRGQSSLLPGGDCRSAVVSLREWHLQAGAVPAGRLPHGTTQGALLDAHLPPQHRQAGPHLSRYSEGQVVARSADPHRAVEYSGAAVGTQSGRSARERCRGPLEDGRGWSRAHGCGVDASLCLSSREIARGDAPSTIVSLYASFFNFFILTVVALLW